MCNLELPQRPGEVHVQRQIILHSFGLHVACLFMFDWNRYFDMLQPLNCQSSNQMFVGKNNSNHNGRAVFLLFFWGKRTNMFLKGDVLNSLTTPKIKFFGRGLTITPASLSANWPFQKQISNSYQQLPTTANTAHLVKVLQNCGFP